MARSASRRPISRASKLSSACTDQRTGFVKALNPSFYSESSSSRRPLSGVHPAAPARGNQTEAGQRTIRGMGCIFSLAIAGRLAQGLSALATVEQAENLVGEAIRRGPAFGARLR